MQRNRTADTLESKLASTVQMQNFDSTQLLYGTAFGIQPKLEPFKTMTRQKFVKGVTNRKHKRLLNELISLKNIERDNSNEDQTSLERTRKKVMSTERNVHSHQHLTEGKPAWTMG